MSGSEFSVVEIAALVVLKVLGVGMVLAFVRMLKGPTLSDRVAAVDAVAMLSVCFIAVASILADRAVFLDAAGPGRRGPACRR